jgi:1-phosphofructokinase
VIRTVTLNPALDRSVVISGFAIDRVNRVMASRIDAGGKGINVSKALAALATASVAYGIVAGRAGDFILDYLAGTGIPHRFARSAGETRTNLKIIDPVGKTHTDINEAGPGIDAASLLALEGMLFADISPGDICVFSGSLPGGCEPNVYARWIAMAAEAGARTVLDADGEPLALGIAARPSLIKPNEHELERLAGCGLRDDASMIAAARERFDGGGGLAAISLGSGGAIFLDAKRAFKARAIPVEAATTVGAGDSMLAAIVRSMSRGDDIERMIAPAIAAGTAAVAAGGSSSITAEAVAAFEHLVRYDEIARA